MQGVRILAGAMPSLFEALDPRGYEEHGFFPDQVKENTF